MPSRVHFLPMLLFAFSSHSALATPVEYWVCTDANGQKTAQDHPCPTPTGPSPAVQAAVEAAESTAHPAPLSDSHVPPSTASAAVAQTPATPKANPYTPIIQTVTKGFGSLAIAAATGIAALALLRFLLARRREPRSASRTSRNSHAPQPHAAPATASELPIEWSLELLFSLEWRRFELLCERLWAVQGYSARNTGVGADGGVDVVIANPDDAARPLAVLQCKAWIEPVGVEPVRALWGARDHFKAASAVFYATAGFHREAQHFATGKALRLIDGKKLLEQLLALPQETRIALLKEITAGDYRTPSCPQCENRMLRRSGQAGQPDFWGCRNYPRCKARPIPIRTGT